jgi:hypothetical protein
MRILLLIFLISLFAFEAIIEALWDKDKKVISKYIQAGQIALIFAFAYWFNPFIREFIAYVFLRYGLFDIVYNLTAHNRLFYIGTVDPVDKKKHFIWDGAPVWAYVLSLVISVGLGTLLIFIK